MAALSPAPKFYEHDQDGAPLVLGKVYTYIAGSETPLATYTNAGGGTPNANPVILDSAGRANIWLSSSSLYKFIVKDSVDALVYSVDNIGGSVNAADLSAATGSSVVGFIQAGAGAVARTAQAKMREIATIEDYGGGTDKTDDQNGAAMEDMLASNLMCGFAVSAGEYEFGDNQILIGRSNTYIRWNGAQVNYDGIGNAVDFIIESGSAYPSYVEIDDIFVVCTGTSAAALNWRASYSRVNGRLTVQGQSSTAARLTESNSSTHNMCHNSIFDLRVACNVGIIGGITTQSGIVCDQAGQVGPNANLFWGRVSAASLGLSIRGSGNVFNMTVEGTATGNTGALVTNAAGAEGNGCSTNTLNLYMEGDNGATGINVSGFANDTIIQKQFASGFGSPGVYIVDTGIRTAITSWSTFAAHFTGMTTDVQGTASYNRNGRDVVVSFPLSTGTSNSVTHTITDLPTLAIPVSAKSGVLALQNNGGAYQFGQWAIAAGSSVVTLTLDAAATAWTASGTSSTRAFTAAYTMD